MQDNHRPILGTFYNNTGSTLTPADQQERFSAFFSGPLLDAGTGVKLDKEKIFTQADDKGVIGILMPYSKNIKNTLTCAISGSLFVKLKEGDALAQNNLVYIDAKTGLATMDETSGKLIGTCLDVGENAYEVNDPEKKDQRYALVQLNLG